MKNALMADGKERMLASDAAQSRLRDLHAAIRAKHAEDLEQAGFFRSILIRRRIEAEFQKERRKNRAVEILALWQQDRQVMPL